MRKSASNFDAASQDAFGARVPCFDDRLTEPFDGAGFAARVGICTTGMLRSLIQRVDVRAALRSARISGFRNRGPLLARVGAYHSGENHGNVEDDHPDYLGESFLSRSRSRCPYRLTPDRGRTRSYSYPWSAGIFIFSQSSSLKIGITSELLGD